MGGLLINFGLMLVSMILLLLFGWFSLLYSIIDALIHPTEIDRKVKSLFLGIAVSLDQLGNVIAGRLFNDLFITREGYKFGNEDQTVSYVLGENERRGTLKKAGKFLVAVLDKIEKDHCKNAKS